MNSSRHLQFSFLSFVFLCVVVALTSCSKKDTVSDEPMMSGGGGFAEESSENVESSGVMTESGSGGGAGSPLQVVYFDYDQYNIRDDARRALQSNSDWMQQNPSSTVQIEGHCDERGTIEYNLALGERRANAAKRYIVRLGVDAGRLSTISYGEERPANSGSNEAAWSENRRAEFVILSQ